MLYISVDGGGAYSRMHSRAHKYTLLLLLLLLFLFGLFLAMNVYSTPIYLVYVCAFIIWFIPRTYAHSTYIHTHTLEFTHTCIQVNHRHLHNLCRVICELLVIVNPNKIYFLLLFVLIFF